MKKFKIVLIALWFIATIYILVSAIIEADKSNGGELLQLHYLGTLLLTAPFGYCLALGGAIIWESLNLFAEALPSFVASWVLMVLGGYLQWFVLVPYLYKKAEGFLGKE